MLTAGAIDLTYKIACPPPSLEVASSHIYLLLLAEGIVPHS